MSQPKELVGSVRLVGYWGDYSPSRYSFVVPDRPLGLTMAQFQPLPRQPDPFWKSCSEKKSLQYISQTTSTKNLNDDFSPVCPLNLRRSSGALEPKSLS